MSKPTLTEYPRMMLVRDSYISLNGTWEYAITQNEDIPVHFEGPIVVPFSPETPLSQVNRLVTPNDVLFYKLVFTLPSGFLKDALILHFGAVDQIATVIFNGTELGTNEGGFLPFEFVIPRHLVQDENTVIVRVRDFSDTSYHGRGKQKLKHGNIWYSPQSGIYMPVWLESVPQNYISNLRITPYYDEDEVEIIVKSSDNQSGVILFNDKEYPFAANIPTRIKVSDKISWSPTNPYLYSFRVTLGEDEVSSYFAMRKVHVAPDNNGTKRIYLNNEIIFQSGLLDQGYYHDGYLTPPNEETLLNDITLAKKMGFNVLRKHIKLEWERFYYHCDRLGMLVWQDFVNGGRSYKFGTVHIPAVFPLKLKDHHYPLFGRQDEKGRAAFYQEVERTINYLYNYPSVILWTVFNEGWGQFDAKKLLPFVEGLDSTRLIDITSGWHDQGIGAFVSRHVYFRKYKFKKDRRNRASLLSEFGGYSLHVSGHAFTTENFGYRHFKNEKELTKAFLKLYHAEIMPAIKRGLCAAIYTQLSDVEDELNGLITYDRKVVKIDVDIVAALNLKLINHPK